MWKVRSSSESRSIGDVYAIASTISPARKKPWRHLGTGPALVGEMDHPDRVRRRDHDQRERRQPVGEDRVEVGDGDHCPGQARRTFRPPSSGERPEPIMNGMGRRTHTHRFALRDAMRRAARALPGSWRGRAPRSCDRWRGCASTRSGRPRSTSAGRTARRASPPMRSRRGPTVRPPGTPAGRGEGRPPPTSRGLDRGASTRPGSGPARAALRAVGPLGPLGDAARADQRPAPRPRLLDLPGERRVQPRRLGGADPAPNSAAIIDRIDADGGDSSTPTSARTRSTAFPTPSSPPISPRCRSGSGPTPTRATPGPIRCPRARRSRAAVARTATGTCSSLRRPAEPGGACDLFELYRALREVRPRELVAGRLGGRLRPRRATGRPAPGRLDLRRRRRAPHLPGPRHLRGGRLR